MKKEKVRPNRRKKNQKNKRSANKKNGSHGKHIKDQKGRISLPKVKPWKVIVGAFILGLLGMFYLKHVLTTQQLLREVQQVERQYNQAKRLNSNYRLTYDRMIGPAEIYDKAKSMDFINGGPAEKVIKVEK